MAFTKKSIIEKLRSCGVKATYSNVVWCYNRCFKIVGGINYSSTACANHVYFIIDKSDIVFVDTFNDIKKLIK